MSLFLIFLIALCLIDCKFQKENPEYLSHDTTKAVNGIFVLLVFYRHFGERVHLENAIDMPMFLLDDYLGQLIVTTFLFYSGYAIMLSLNRKENYVATIPRNRILTTLLHFDSAVVLFMILNLILGREMTLTNALFSLVA